MRLNVRYMPLLAMSRTFGIPSDAVVETQVFPTLRPPLTFPFELLSDMLWKLAHYV